MRLKAIDGPLGVHHTNANGNLVNSPKRLNTLQNSNVTTTKTATDQCDNDALLAAAECIISNIHGGRWSEEALSLTSGRYLIDNLTGDTLAARSASGSGSPEDDSLLLDFEEARSSSDTAEEEDDDQEVEEEGEGDQLSDISDSDSEDGNAQQPVQIDANVANNNSIGVFPDAIESGNRLDSVENIQKVFYDKPVVLNITESGPAVEHVLVEACEKLAVADADDADFQPSATRYNIEPNVSDHHAMSVTMAPKMASNGGDEMKRKFRQCGQPTMHDSNRLVMEVDVEKFCKEDASKDEPEKDVDSAVPRKRDAKKRQHDNRRAGPIVGRDHHRHRKSSTELLGGFDVYNIETAMPKIDLEAIELHLRAAREEERRRRTDREEIRRRLAMGTEEDYYSERPGRKPSLQARLQSGMNLQICFMNETVSDSESPSSDSECTLGKPRPAKKPCDEKGGKGELSGGAPVARPATLALGQPQRHTLPPSGMMPESDFFAKQARLQTEARMALAQAKEMARMQMQIERQRQKQSPITEMVRHSMEKVGIPFPEDRRRLSRQILTEMNVAQLQVIVNDLHTQIEMLNEDLVKFLMARDDLHMEQDSMLVDVEDLTRFLGAKEHMIKASLATNNNLSPMPPSPAPSSPQSVVKPHFSKLSSLVKK